MSEGGAVSCWMIYNGAVDVPAWLRAGGLPITGTGGLLGRGGGPSQVGAVALGLLGVLAVVLALLGSGWRRGGG